MNGLSPYRQLNSAVDVHIWRLRALLEMFGVDSMIQTVRGVGYRLSASIEGVAP